jgi:hypothetical protein
MSITEDRPVGGDFIGIERPARSGTDTSRTGQGAGPARWHGAVQSRVVRLPWLVPGALVTGSALVWSLNPIVGFLLLIAALAVFWRRTVATPIAIVAAPAALMFAWAVLGQLLAITDLPLLTSRLAWAAAWVVLGVLVALGGRLALRWLATTVASPQQESTALRVTGGLRWVWAPAGLVTVVAIFQSAIFDRVAGWMTIGTDPMQQILLMQQMSREGSLGIGLNSGANGDLTYQVYPKGLHWLATAVLGPVLDPAQLSSAAAFSLFLRTYAGFVWMMVALMFCVAGAIFVSAVKRRRLGTPAALAAMATLTAFVIVLPQFTFVAVLQGGMASTAAVTAVWALWWVAIEAPRLRVVLAVVAVGIFITANTWQPLTAVVAIAGACMIAPRVRSMWIGLRQRRLQPATLVALALAVFTYVVVTATPLSALVLARGDRYATIPGLIVTPNYYVFGAEVLAVVAWSVRGLRNGKTLLLRTGWGLVAGSALAWLGMLAAAHGNATTYYPVKLLWFVNAFGWPVIALVFGVLLVAVARRLRPFTAPGWAILIRTPVLWATAVGIAILALAAMAPWALQFPPQAVVLASGWVDRSAAADLGLLPPARGTNYVPYDLSAPWDPPWAKEYLGAKVLAFRFGTPHMVWSGRGNKCAILRLEAPVTVVSPLPRDAVTKFLVKNHCAISSWHYLQIVDNPPVSP